jgi:glucosyl-dolichyl phosphate glucuronosyltransferase
MTLSTIVCTFNRAASLQRTLQSLAEATAPPDCPWELIVVDNNSTDETRTVIESFIADGRLPLRRVMEESPGLSHARNRGVAVAAGEIVSFTDDDVVVDPDWLTRIAEAFAGFDAAAVGGRILPLWETPPPDWLDAGLHAYLALADYGDRPVYLETPKVWGANLSFRAEVFRRFGRFDTALGRAPGKLYAGEEVDYLRKLLRAGEKILYYPPAVVFHCIGGRRVTKEYFRRWKYDQGELEAMGAGPGSGGDVARHLFRLISREIPRYAAHTILRSRKSFAAELKVFHTLGCLSGMKNARGAPAGRPVGLSQAGTRAGRTGESP